MATTLIAAPAQPPAVDDRLARRRAVTVLLAVAAGVVLATAWSFKLVDQKIGDNVANHLLGFDAKTTAISGSAVGVAFAFVSGMAGTFTACNVAAFGALAPLVSGNGSRRSRIVEALKPMGWLLAGMCAVSATYGVIAVLAGPGIPQLSTKTLGAHHFPVRLLQSSVVFGVVGLAMVYLGLTTLGVLPNPLAKLYERHPRAQFVVMGALIGMFLIGRPFALFHKMLQDAVDRHNVLYGALTFVLQSIGNVVLLVVLFLLLSLGTGGRLQRWLEAKPGRAARVTAVSLILFGVFFVTYWDVRLPAMFHYGWWPTMPWNA